jgi:F-type H+-transporting ATPase subunit a
MKATKTRIYFTACLLFILAFSLTSESVFAENEQHELDTTKHAETGFNPGDFVMHHVSDAFEWHIATFGETHISIPLPIILYSGNSGWHFFWSSKFHHGEVVYKNFEIAHQGENSGKIVELDEHGEVVGLPVDLSITKTVAGVIFSVILLLWIFLSVAKSAKRNANQAPKGLQNLIEPIILFLRDEVAKPAIGEKKYEKFMPFLLSLFFFILVNNFMGLIPIFPFGANVTGNIAVTMALALFTFVVTTINGNKHYWKEIYNPDVPWWLKFPIPLMPIVELSGVITKPFVLMVRLFANMMAGHLIVMVFISLIFIFANLMGPAAGAAISPVSVAFSVFILMLDLLVSFIQAYVFTLLSALYFGMATSEHH